MHLFDMYFVCCTEHKADSLLLYFALQKFSDHALALVVSSPDRHRLCHGSPACVQGPPSNPSHVREWLVQELEIMFLDHRMFPVASGWVCAQGGTCGHGFTPETNPYTTAILIMANTQVGH